MEKNELGATLEKASDAQVMTSKTPAEQEEYQRHAFKDDDLDEPDMLERAHYARTAAEIAGDPDEEDDEEEEVPQDVDGSDDDPILDEAGAFS